jgi:hypothetical protein
MHLRETHVVAFDAMAAHTQGILLGSGRGITLDVLRVSSRSGRASDKQRRHDQQNFVHFAKTIRRWALFELININQL